MSWSYAPIGEHVQSVHSWNPARSTSEEVFKYIDLSSVDKETKRICLSEVSMIVPRKAPSRARQLVKESDILIATVRPNLNGVAEVPRSLDGATASTGYCVLRANGETLYPRYLFYWVQAKSFVLDMISKATGANYPAVSDRIVKESEMPLPPIEEQRRIVAVLDKADGLRRKRQQAIQLGEEFLRAIFLNMFSDVEGNGWEILQIQNVASSDKGSIRTGPFGSQLLHSEFAEDGVAVLGIDNAVENRFKWGKSRFISDGKYQSLRRYTVKPGDVLITIMGTCGRCAVVPNDIPPAINTKHLCCITLDRDICLPEFLHSYFLYHPKSHSYLEKSTKGAIMSGLNMEIIKEMPIPQVPIELQHQYTKLVTGVRQFKSGMEDGEAACNDLFESLSQKAFSGEL